MHHMSLRQGLRSFSAKAPPHGLTRDSLVLGELDQFPRQTVRASNVRGLRWFGTGRRDQERLLFAESLRLAPGRGSSQSAASRLPRNEALLGPIDVEPPAPTLLAISSSLAPASAASKNLRPLELAHRVLAPAQKRGEFGALGLLSSTR